MKGHLRSLATLVLLASTQATALTDNVKQELMFITKPWAVTHLNELNTDCLWTRGDNGYLNSEASASDGTGVCWDISAVKQAEKLDKDKKLVWHNPPRFDYEYGDKNKCYYRVDKENGLVDLRYGDDAITSGADQCNSEEAKNAALNLATRVEKKVEFDGYTATKNNILGSVTLACFTGGIDSDSRVVSNEERSRRYAELLNLYEGDEINTRRIRNAFNFANLNLRDRYPLDTMGEYRASICNAMVLNGKL
ncbi:TPA: hypothetical protein ACUE4H_003689 [Klebsiella quasipneumoniae]